MPVVIITCRALGYADQIMSDKQAKFKNMYKAISF